LAALPGCGPSESEDLAVDTVELRSDVSAEEAAEQSGPRRELFVLRESQFSHEETVARALASLQQRDLTVFALIDHQANAAEADLALKPSVVVIFGSPEIGTPLLQAAPLAAATLPLRMAIYENRRGEVIVAVPSVGALRDTLPGLETQADRLDTISRNLAVLLDEVTGDEEG
jgi:uncharacterized protein (DUF302 family)